MSYRNKVQHNAGLCRVVRTVDPHWNYDRGSPYEQVQKDLHCCCVWRVQNFSKGGAHRSRSVILIDQPISRPVSSLHFLLDNVLLAQAHAAQHGYDQGEPKSISSRVPQKTSNTTIWGTFGESASKKRLQKRGPSQPCPSNSVRMHAF
jgi:hypothetical protein